VGHPGAEIEIICGYRTAWSNEFLRARSAGVAKNSQHMQAHAIDIRIPGVDTLILRNAALALGRGSVGYYPRSGFVHVDSVSNCRRPKRSKLFPVFQMFRDFRKQRLLQAFEN
jgi:uncharacterized protein YcbK (DUF882 family)